ncbi:MAG TPA: HDOD domain-containing protein, partial [Rhodothermales bacterium]|nr:HDOD domain-containing protein [Rhodothermales bacterium]
MSFPYPGGPYGGAPGVARGGARAGSRAGTLARLELRCPPLPHTLIEAMDLLADLEQADTRAVTAMIERDPLVTARLLQKVNS